MEARLVHDPLLALAGEIFEVAWEATGGHDYPHLAPAETAVIADEHH